MCLAWVAEDIFFIEKYYGQKMEEKEWMKEVSARIRSWQKQH